MNGVLGVFQVFLRFQISDGLALHPLVCTVQHFNLPKRRKISQSKKKAEFTYGVINNTNRIVCHSTSPDKIPFVSLFFSHTHAMKEEEEIQKEKGAATKA